MTKAELIGTINSLNKLVAELNDRIDELEGMAIASSAIPLDADSSHILSLMNQRIKALEEKNAKSDN